MKQSRSTSFLKSVVSTAVGFAISFAAQLIFLPMLGVPINLTQNTAFAVIMTIISVGRGFIMERVFEAMGWRTRMSAFALAVLAERRRQIASEGWTIEHDDEHRAGELGMAGASYCLSARWQIQGYAPSAIEPPDCWPWEREWWKPAGFRRDLVKAAALIFAEGEKFDRNRNRKPADAESIKQQWEEKFTGTRLAAIGWTLGIILIAVAVSIFIALYHAAARAGRRIIGAFG